MLNFEAMCFYTIASMKFDDINGAIGYSSLLGKKSSTVLGMHFRLPWKISKMLLRLYASLCREVESPKAIQFFWYFAKYPISDV